VVAVLILGGAPLSSCSFNPGDINLVVKQTDLSPKSGPKDFKTIEIEIDNSGSGVARGIVVKDTRAHRVHGRQHQAHARGRHPDPDQRPSHQQPRAHLVVPGASPGTAAGTHRP